MSYRRLLQCNMLLALMSLSILSFGQTATVRGNVRDANNLPLAGASVIIQGTSQGTTTDESGFYQLNTPTGRQTLVVSYVGFTSQRRDINVTAGVNNVDVVLAQAGDLSTVTIVGSRSAARTRTETPVPVDIIPIAQVMNDIGQVELNQIMNFIAPSFQSARQTVADGTDHVDPGQLRGLGPDQVLVLINGKRRHQSALVNVNGTVNRGTVGTDLSAIPANAIERIEILRDGASAQYGSDAIAGVINIVLKRRTGLIDANVSYGMYMSEYPKNYALYKILGKTDDPNVSVNDGENFQGALTYGFNLGKGFLSLTGEYTSRAATNRGGTYTGAIFPTVNGLNRDDSILSARGLTRNSFDMAIGNSDIEAKGLFYNLGIPVGARGEFYMFGGYNNKEGVAAGFYRYPGSVPAAVRQNVLAIYPNGFLPNINSDIDDISTSVGLRTMLGSWNFDISNTYGRNNFDFSVTNSANYTQFTQSATSRQTSFDAGGTSFWQNTVNADFSKKFEVLEGLNVASGLEYRVDAFGIRSGEEASYKNYDVNAGVAAGAQVFAGFRDPSPNSDFDTRNAKAVYLDLEQDFTRNFLVTGALRFENYSDFGSTLNYKLATRYKLGESVNLRASASSGFRAPSMQQRFYAKTNTLFVSTPNGLVPVESGTFTNDSRAAKILGIPELQEETSRSISAGFTAKPFRSLEVTVDAYQIDIDNRIVLTNNFSGGNNAQLQQQLSDAGASQANFFTNAIDTRSRGLEAVLAHSANFAGKHSLRTTLAMTFIDNEVKKGSDGKPIIYASPTLISSGQIGNYFNREDQSRVEVANPTNKVNLMFNYKVNKFGAMLRFVRFGEVTYLDPSINPANPAAWPMNAFNNNQRETLDQTFSAKTVTDLSLSYQFLPQLGLTVGANNLFDVYQDMHQHSNNMSLGRFVYSRRVQQMGFNGAYYFARLRLAIPTK